MIGVLICQIVLSIILASVFLIRPTLTHAASWKILAFIGLCVLPALCIVGGMNTHIQRSEQTRFCVSCHVMVPYGQSLYVDDPSHLPAQHFQNHRVPANMACYSCHADYSIYGPMKDKLQGLKRIYIQ
ncbi:MAG: NapC/NirT family cytochrome c, partial [Candidatus Acidiferrales bacterium]